MADNTVKFKLAAPRGAKPGTTVLWASMPAEGRPDFVSAVVGDDGMIEVSIKPTGDYIMPRNQIPMSGS